MRFKLKNKRIEKGYTQESISKKLEVSRSTYTNIELGHKNPSFTLYINIKELLNYSKDDLFLDNKREKEIPKYK